MNTAPTNKWLSDKDFEYVYSMVPRLNLDLVIKSPSGTVLTKRSIEPYINNWHLPGGTLYKGEKVAEAAVRIAKTEAGVDATFDKTLGYMEFLNERRSTINAHTVSIVAEMTVAGGELKADKNASEIAYFRNTPDGTIPEHANFLTENSILIHAK